MTKGVYKEIGTWGRYSLDLDTSDDLLCVWYTDGDQLLGPHGEFSAKDVYEFLKENFEGPESDT